MAHQTAGEMVVCQRSGFAGGGGGGENTQWGDLLSASSFGIHKTDTRKVSLRSQGVGLLEEVDGLAGERFGKALHK